MQLIINLLLSDGVAFKNRYFINAEIKSSTLWKTLFLQGIFGWVRAIINCLEKVLTR
jgi:hypothetical protein